MVKMFKKTTIKHCTVSFCMWEGFLSLKCYWTSSRFILFFLNFNCSLIVKVYSLTPFLHLFFCPSSLFCPPFFCLFLLVCPLNDFPPLTTTPGHDFQDHGIFGTIPDGSGQLLFKATLWVLHRNKRDSTLDNCLDSAFMAIWLIFTLYECEARGGNTVSALSTISSSG